MQQQQIQIVSTPDQVDQPEGTQEASEKRLEKKSSQVGRWNLEDKSVPDGTPGSQEENHTRFNAVDDEENLG